jgi:CheY-like chemotaxis protein
MPTGWYPPFDLQASTRVVRLRPRYRAPRLVVDDDALALEVLCELLVDFGANVIAASSVGEGIALVQQYRPDVIVSDIRMRQRHPDAGARWLSADQGRADLVIDGRRVYARDRLERIRAPRGLRARFAFRLPSAPHQADPGTASGRDHCKTDRTVNLVANVWPLRPDSANPASSGISSAGTHRLRRPV